MSTSKVINDKRTQIIHLPVNMRLPPTVKRVNIRALGLVRIITPVESTWDSFFLNSPTVPDDFLLTRARQESPTRESL